MSLSLRQYLPNCSLDALLGIIKDSLSGFTGNLGGSKRSCSGNLEGFLNGNGENRFLEVYISPIILTIMQLTTLSHRLLLRSARSGSCIFVSILRTPTSNSGNGLSVEIASMEWAQRPTPAQCPYLSPSHPISRMEGGNTMFGWEHLKPSNPDQLTLCCQRPVRDCPSFVKAAKEAVSKGTLIFRCPQHGICISPSTFEYETDADNMLWTVDADLALWRAINAPGVKRENRIARDNSEDAVTWNVFRFPENFRRPGRRIHQSGCMAKTVAGTPRVIYWSYCQQSRRAWSPLLDAAKLFGEGDRNTAQSRTW